MGGFKMIDDIKRQLKESAELTRRIQEQMSERIEVVSQVIISSLKKNKKIMLCGCGGSAADCQHIAAEFINKFRFDRNPLPAISFATDTSALTSISNDSHFDYAFKRQVEALAIKGDVLIAISTSGNSRSIINAAEKAQEKGVIVIGLTGQSGGKLKDKCDYLLNVPSNDTPRIQEGHITIAHIICDIVEREMFMDKNETSH